MNGGGESSESSYSSESGAWSLGIDVCVPDTPRDFARHPFRNEWEGGASGSGPTAPRRIDWSGPDAAALVRRYVEEEKMFVIHGAEAMVPSFLSCDESFWRTNYGDETLPLNVNRSSAISMPLSWALDSFAVQKDHQGIYLRNLHLRSWFPEHRELLQGMLDELATVFGPNLLRTWPTQGDGHGVPCISEDWTQWVELFISGKGTACPLLHADVANTHAWAVQVQGVKRFFAIDPAQAADTLYLHDVNPRISLLSDIDFPDLEAFPDFARAHVHVLDLKPGELLWIPPNMFHTTRVVSSGVNITLAGNMVTEGNRDAFLAALSGSPDACWWAPQ